MILSKYTDQYVIYLQPNQSPRSEELRDTNPTSFDEHHSANDDDHIITCHSSVSKTGPVQQYWILLATAIDRIAFIIYFVLFFVLAISYAV